MSPKCVVQALLSGLALDEVVCMPALVDTGLLAQLDEVKPKLFGESRSGNLAQRYKPED